MGFRPLTGTLLSKHCLHLYNNIGAEVSVPSRGLSYLNKIKNFLKKVLTKVSVPSRGLSYLNVLMNYYSS